MTQLSANQKIQDEQYRFPYHYLSRNENGVFRQAMNWDWALNYQSTLDFLLERLSKENFSSVMTKNMRILPVNMSQCTG